MSLLANLRKEKGWSQTELGQKIFTRLNKGNKKSSGSYAQKRVSMWESGDASPTSEELKALSEELDVPPEKLKSSIDPRTPFPATEVFNHLATTESHSIAAICYSGTPVAQAYKDLFASVQSALDRNMFLAMFVPYPEGTTLSKNLSTRKKVLESFYKTVRDSVEVYRDSLRSGIAKEKKANVAVFVPREENSNIIIPPFLSRYALITEGFPDNQISKTLYLWLDTKDSAKFEKISTIAYYPMLSQFQQWEGYYDEVLSFWEEQKRLPSTDAELLKLNSKSTWKLLE